VSGIPRERSSRADDPSAFGPRTVMVNAAARTPSVVTVAAPLARALERSRDEAALSIRVEQQAVARVTGELALQGAVLPCFLGMRLEVIAEEQVVVPEAALVLHDVQAERIRIALSEVRASRYAGLAEVLVTESAQRLDLRVAQRQVRDAHDD